MLQIQSEQAMFLFCLVENDLEEMGGFEDHPATRDIII